MLWTCDLYYMSPNGKVLVWAGYLLTPIVDCEERLGDNQQEDSLNVGIIIGEANVAARSTRLLSQRCDAVGKILVDVCRSKLARKTYYGHSVPFLRIDNIEPP
jgi:hypothetical protein